MTHIDPGNTQRADDAPAGSGRAISLGRYRLIARLGTGGMAEVFLAVAQGAMNVNRLVVLKRLRDEQAGDEGAREMFLNEARLAARLAHPNVIQTFEAGSENGSWFLAMEYVDGQPLSRVLTAMKKEGRRLDVRIAARVCADALHGLHYAHELRDFDGSELRIVHRDVSPQNIMLTYDGVVKIVDFGIAKAANTAQTAHGVFKGKVAFMAPEQVLGEQIDRRADVFAAGIVLWEAVTGKHLMADENPAKTLNNLMNRRIPRASDMCSDIPAVLDDIIAKALERDVAMRFASAKEMRDALEAWLASVGGVTPEQVGAVVLQHFGETREKVQKQIKAQLAALSLARMTHPDIGSGDAELSRSQIRTTGAVLIDLSEGAIVGTDPATSRAGFFRLTTTGSGVLRTTTAPPAPSSRTRSIAFVAWVGVTLAAVGVSGLALYRAQNPVVAAASAAPAAKDAAPTAVLTSSPSAPATVIPAPTSATTATAPPTGTTTSATSQASTSHAPPPPVVPAWRPPVAAAAPPPAKPTATSAPAPSAPNTTEAPRVAAPSPVKEPPKPAETATGRTFRRDL